MNRFVAVWFMDHAIEKGGDGEPVECMAVGELLSVTKDKIILRHWHSINYEDNDETAVILRPVVTKWLELKPRRAKRNY